MSDWTDGYVADTTYTHGYFNELNPLRAGLALVNHRIAPPAFESACELGFGQGVTVNIHAAASSVRWWGNDFNPAHAAFASSLAQAAGSGAALCEDSFAEYAARTDLPDFDFIALHGVWSWVTEENRQVVVDFVRRRLRPGGVLYVSYNTLPGWAPLAPLRQLMKQHADALGTAGEGGERRAGAALDFIERLIATDPSYMRAQPQLAERVQRIKGQNRRYVSHEYLNREWWPMYFAEVAQRLGQAKLQYACSAAFADHMETGVLTDAQRAFLGEVPDPVFRESVRDFVVNQVFRRDYWVKGAVPLTPMQQREALLRQRVVPVVPVADIPEAVKVRRGTATLTPEVRGPLLEALSAYRPMSLGELGEQLAARGVRMATLIEMVTVLIGSGHLAPAQDDAAIRTAAPQARRLNAALLERQRSVDEIAFLASPVLGGAVRLGRVPQLFLDCLRRGITDPDSWGLEIWNLLTSQGHRVLRGDTPIEGREENLVEIGRQAREFQERLLPLLRGLGVAVEPHAAG